MVTTTHRNFSMFNKPKALRMDKSSPSNPHRAAEKLCESWKFRIRAAQSHGYHGSKALEEPKAEMRTFWIEAFQWDGPLTENPCHTTVELLDAHAEPRKRPHPAPQRRPQGAPEHEIIIPPTICGEKHRGKSLPQRLLTWVGVSHLHPSVYNIKGSSPQENAPSTLSC